LGFSDLAFHRGTAGNPAGYNANVSIFVQARLLAPRSSAYEAESADYAPSR